MELNQPPSGYEPPALTDELRPRVRLQKQANRCEYIRFERKLYNGSIVKNKIIQLLHRVATLAQRFSDLRFVGQVIFVIIVLLVSFSGVKYIQVNYSLQRQIGSLRQQNSLQRLKNDNQKLQNEYYKSKQYLELAARQNYPLAAPGEKELDVPKTVAESYVADLPHEPVEQVADSKPAVHQQNFQAWIDFFLHRNAN